MARYTNRKIPRVFCRCGKLVQLSTAPTYRIHESALNFLCPHCGSEIFGIRREHREDEVGEIVYDHFEKTVWDKDWVKEHYTNEGQPGVWQMPSPVERV